jgi:hypothetical protein
MESIIVKALENPDNPKLKLKYVGALEYVTPKINTDGKIITGLDENSIDIQKIENTNVRLERIKNIKKEREELERLLGVDLAPTSNFWDDFFIILSDEETTLDPNNPLDRLKEKFLVANKYVAPSIEAIENEDDYVNCVFYLHREKEENKKKATKQLERDEAKYKLVSLKKSNPNKLVQLYSYIYGYDASNIDVDEAYLKLSQGFEDVDEKVAKRNIDLFLTAEDKSPEQLSVKLILDKAIKKKIVSSKKGIYRRGDIILGNSYDEALDYLVSIENQSELSSIMKEVNHD